MPTENRDWLDYIDVFGGLLMTSVTFLLGFFISQRIEKRKVKQDLKLQRSYFDLYWKYQIDVLDAEIKEMKNFAERLEKCNSFEKISVSVHLQPYSIYEAVDKQKLVESFRIENQEKIVLNRMIFIEFIQKKNDEFAQLNISSQNRNQELLSEWNSVVKEIHALMLELYNSTIDNLLKDEYLKIASSCLNKVNEFDNVDELINKVIKPTTDYFNSVLNSKFSDHYAIQFLQLFSKLTRLSNSYINSMFSLSNTVKMRIDLLLEKKKEHINLDKKE